MKKESIQRKLKLGFSMMEMLIAIVLIGILGSGLMIVTSNLSKNAKHKMVENNAKTINRMLDTIRAAGGCVEDKVDADVNTTSINTLIDCLSKENPLKIDEIEFKLEPKPEFKFYEVEGISPNKKVKVRLPEKESSQHETKV